MQRLAIKVYLVSNLLKALRADAKASKTTVQAVILACLATHYGIDVPAPVRGRPSKKVVKR